MQAATNVLTAHIVSIAFLVMLIKRITTAYERIVEWSEGVKGQLSSLAA